MATPLGRLSDLPPWSAGPTHPDKSGRGSDDEKTAWECSFMARRIDDGAWGEPGKISRRPWRLSRIEVVTMWTLLKAVLKEEMNRLWRRLMKRPEPPNPYTQFRLQRQNSLSPSEPRPDSHSE